MAERCTQLTLAIFALTSVFQRLNAATELRRKGAMIGGMGISLHFGASVGACDVRHRPQNLQVLPLVTGLAIPGEGDHAMSRFARNGLSRTHIRGSVP